MDWFLVIPHTSKWARSASIRCKQNRQKNREREREREWVREKRERDREREKRERERVNRACLKENEASKSDGSGFELTQRCVALLVVPFLPTKKPVTPTPFYLFIQFPPPQKKNNEAYFSKNNTTLSGRLTWNISKLFLWPSNDLIDHLIVVNLFLFLCTNTHTYTHN